MNFHKIIRIVFCLFITGIFFVHCSGLKELEFIKRLEYMAYDIKLRASLLDEVDNRIVIVDIDEKSLSALGQWPWPRKSLARMVDNLFNHYQIKTLGFDMVFAEPDRSSDTIILDKLASKHLRNNAEFLNAYAKIKPQLEYDKIFANSLRNRNTILGFLFTGDAKTKGILPDAEGSKVGDNILRLPVFKRDGYTANLPVLQNSALSAGFFDNPTVDNDGVFRRVPLIQIHNGIPYQSLALQVARSALDYPSFNVIVTSTGRKKNDYNAIEHIEIGDRKILVDEKIAALVPFRGTKGSFPYISAVDVIRKSAQKLVLEDKIVLFGTSAPGLLDLRSTPVEKVYPGVEIHANLVAGILDQTIKHEPQYVLGYSATLVIIIGLMMALLIPRLVPLTATMSLVGLIAFLLVLNMLAWQAHIVLPIASHLLLAIILFAFQMSYGFFVESRNKKALSKVFGQYIPPELVDELDNDAKTINLAGESREMTVLFSDVRNFTSISENLDPQQLSQMMNELLTPLTNVIHKHRGTIDKYMGDAIMAFWGAPLHDPYHQKNAVLAALEMVKVLQQQQSEFKNKGWPEINIGVGLNTGTMNVGNMGSEFRMAYTVLGDAVNLGSRLEGLTKQYGVDIIVSESIQKNLPEFEFLELDKVRVKGKLEPITIYEPLGFSIEQDKSIRLQTKQFSKALELYRAQNWDQAEREVFNLSQQNPNKKVYQIYLDRINQLRNTPPAEGWDGTYTHTTK